MDNKKHNFLSSSSLSGLIIAIQVGWQAQSSVEIDIGKMVNKLLCCYMIEMDTSLEYKLEYVWFMYSLDLIFKFYRWLVVQDTS